MRTLLWLGPDRQAAAAPPVPDGWTLDRVGSWNEVIHRLTARRPPDALLFGVEHLGEEGERAILGLRRKGFFVPAAVHLDGAGPAEVHRAGRLHRHGVEPVFSRAELEPAIGRLAARSEPLLHAALTRVLRVGRGTGDRLLSLLDDDPEAWSAPPERLARSLGTSRSGLYRALRTEGLPPPGAIQALYRLWPGVLRIARGGRGEDAAFEASCPHYLAFRRAVATHFGLTIRDVRTLGDPAALLRRWALHQRADRGGAAPDATPSPVRWDRTSRLAGGRE